MLSPECGVVVIATGAGFRLELLDPDQVGGPAEAYRRREAAGMLATWPRKYLVSRDECEFSDSGEASLSL